MEGFITGHPATEEGQRQAVLQVLGPDLGTRFFECFLEAFFGEADAAYLASVGLNAVRVAVNHRRLPAGYHHLDRVIADCAKHGIYTIIDLHAAPGWQNPDWHSDNPTHIALLWRERDFQDATVELWEAIASRYRGNPWVAGYNLLNEPAAPSGEILEKFYQRLCRAVRAIDPDHVVFLDGNRFSADFSGFGDPLPNAVYAIHYYARPGFVDGGPYPGETGGRHYDRAVLEQAWAQRTEYMRRHGVPVWLGEFGPVYTGAGDSDDGRHRLLRDQLEIAEAAGAGWSLWTYKDLGLQGLVHVRPDSPWMKRLAGFLDKKARLGVDPWAGHDGGMRPLLAPLEAAYAREFPGHEPAPFGSRWMIHRLVRHILFAEPLLAEYAQCFAGLAESELDALMGSFRFESCVRRERLAGLLGEAAR